MLCGPNESERRWFRAPYSPTEAEKASILDDRQRCERKPRQFFEGSVIAHVSHASQLPLISTSISYPGGRARSVRMSWNFCRWIQPVQRSIYTCPQASRSCRRGTSSESDNYRKFHPRSWIILKTHKLYALYIGNTRVHRWNCRLDRDEMLWWFEMVDDLSPSQRRGQRCWSLCPEKSTIKINVSSARAETILTFVPISSTHFQLMDLGVNKTFWKVTWSPRWILAEISFC